MHNLYLKCTMLCFCTQTNFEDNNAGSNFETQYSDLISSINEIYKTAKAGHAKGIDMLIKDFEYHPAFKTHNSTFTAVPFKPK